MHTTTITFKIFHEDLLHEDLLNVLQADLINEIENKLVEKFPDLEFVSMVLERLEDKLPKPEPKQPEPLLEKLEDAFSNDDNEEDEVVRKEKKPRLGIVRKDWSKYAQSLGFSSEKEMLKRVYNDLGVGLMAKLFGMSSSGMYCQLRKHEIFCNATHQINSAVAQQAFKSYAEILRMSKSQ